MRGFAVNCGDRGVLQGVVKLYGVQQLSVAARHHTERCSGSASLLGDLIPYLESGGDFGAVVGGGHTVPR